MPATSKDGGRNLSGQSIGYGTSTVRWLVKFVSFLAVGLGCFWVGLDDYRQGWHDKAAGTYVVGREFVRK